MKSARIEFPDDWGTHKFYSRFELFDWYLPKPEHRDKDHKYHLLIRQLDGYIVSTHKIDIDDCHYCPTCKTVQPFGSGLRDSWTCQLCGSDSSAGEPHDEDIHIDFTKHPDFNKKGNGYFYDSFEFEYFLDKVKDAFEYMGQTKFGNHLFKRIKSI